MRYITSEEIVQLGISPSTCMAWVKEAFVIKRQSILPPKISIHPQGSDFINTMPCLMPDKYHRFGCKVVSRIKGAKQALKSDMMLIDSKSGETIAILNADWITAMRTGAVATVAIETFQKSDATVYSFIGLGVIGHAVLDCFLESNSDRKITVRFIKYKNHAEETINKYKCFSNVTFEIVDSMEDLVKNADVVVSCITEAKDILVKDITSLKPGVLLVPVHTRGFQNCDMVFDKIFADDEGHVKSFRYFNEFKKFGEIGDVLNGVIQGRENDEERIISYNIGIGLHDVLFADRIVKLLDNKSSF